MPGRSSAVLATWLDRQSAAFRGRIEVVAMDRFGGYKHAAISTVPDAVTVMDPFHVVALAGTKLDLCRQRIRQHTCGHRGRSGDPLYGVRCAARIRQELLSDRQRRRLGAVFADERRLPFALTRRVY
ncbi:transposase [Rhodococcus ruber]|uniref:transposase n=1 Tax=Rhodococcus ruber TaxID=1830 RepID=UPI00265F0781|nr:transposase [Rhodococcus ruber]